jgi:plastocyanin
VLQGSDFTIPNPSADGRFAGAEKAAILGMSTDITDANGKPIPIQRLMLHHIVFLNGGNPSAGRVLPDATCKTLTFPDNQTTVPALAERFYSAGEERSVFDLPNGYGYKVSAQDRWGMLFMVMNHRDRSDSAFIQYTITYTTEPEAAELRDVTPFWFDVENCKADPFFDAPGGGKPGSTITKRFVWTAPKNLRIVAGQGHVHGGAKIVRLRQLDCGNRVAAESIPTWGTRRHPFYTVRPILHEPGPINMTRFHSDVGIPVAKGQRIEFEAVYDNELPHTRVMATLIGAYKEDSAVTPETACGPLPEVTYRAAEQPGRTETPRFTVPLVDPPSAETTPVPTDTIKVNGQQFSPRRVELHTGQKLRWIFNTPDGNANLHDVTVANGPRGFASPHLSEGRRFSHRFDVAGRYQLFCSLHPVSMSQEVIVRR